jgi:hypothetical protein
MPQAAVADRARHGLPEVQHRGARGGRAVVQGGAGVSAARSEVLAADLSEARRLLGAGLQLVKLRPFSKQPEGDDWNHRPVAAIDDHATGYGLLLAANKLCSVDPDDVTRAHLGMRALGFDLEQIMQAGVRTRSTRLGSGGRTAFAAEGDLAWLKFSSPQTGTVIEFRAESPNLQDVLPGLVYRDRAGNVCTQEYANGKRLDDAPPLPTDLYDWWRECSANVELLRDQQRRFFEAIGAAPHLAISVSKGAALAFPAPGYRGDYNARHTVEEHLERHGYSWHAQLRRWSPSTATGAPGVRPIEGKDGLWRSDHASDPLHGTFDAWTAFVVLEHGGDADAAMRAFDTERRTTRKPPPFRAEPATHADADPWPEPVDFLRELRAPPFQPDDVPEVLGAFAFRYATQTGIDPSLCVSAAVTAAASAINDEFALVADSGTGWMQPARLWFLDVAPSGAGKSPAQRAMLAPLHELQRELMHEYGRACDNLPDDGSTPPRPRVVIADTTIEALSEALRDNPRGLLVANDEFEGFLGSLDQYRRGGASRDRGEWLRAFDGGPHTIERIQRGSVHVPNFGVSLLTATTPTALAKVARLLGEDGLLQRFLVVVARRQQDGAPVPDVERARDDFGQLLRALWHAEPRLHRGKVPMTQEAREAFAAWRRTQRLLQESLDALDPGLGAHVAKFPTFALRLALTFHVANILDRDATDDPAAWPLTLPTLQSALRFLDRCRQHALCLYLGLRGGSEAFDLARDIARTVAAVGAPHLERRDLLRRCWSFRKADPREQSVALDLLHDLGWLRATDTGYRKAEPTRFDVNPSVRERFAALAERERERRAVVRALITESAGDA